MYRITREAGEAAIFTAVLSAEPDGSVLRFAGELDLASEDAACDALGAAWEDDPPRLVLDLAGLTFLASSAVRCLLAAQAAAEARSRPFELVVGPVSRRTLALCGVLPRFSFSDA